MRSKATEPVKLAAVKEQVASVVNIHCLLCNLFAGSRIPCRPKNRMSVCTGQMCLQSITTVSHTKIHLIITQNPYSLTRGSVSGAFEESRAVEPARTRSKVMSTVASGGLSGKAQEDPEAVEGFTKRPCTKTRCIVF
jgi:hypothetical protein